MTYTFLPWLREGAAGDLAADAEGPNRVQAKLRLQLNDTPLEPTQLRLLGPGDVLGFDERLVVRTDPADLATAVEPNLFPSVELDVPTLPWLFTPAGPDADNRLRTWIRLVIVRKQEGVSVAPHPRTKIEILSIAPPAVPAAELPDPAESWAWAHVQVTGAAGSAELERVLAEQPERSVARLLCPRRLDRASTYLACVVPAFAAGVAAALAEPVDDDALLADAWELGDQSVALPVYYSWEFSTGEAGDFESLARAIKGGRAAPGVGRRPLDLSDTGFAPPSGANIRPPAEGALRAVGDPPAGADWFTARMAGLLAAADARAVRPPLYGGTQKGVDALPTAGWIRELNVGARHRMAAGLGVRIVREQQERWMEAAWAQAGDIDSANRYFARQQLAASVGESVMGRRLTALADDDPNALLQVTAPARLALGGSPARAQAAGLPDTALDPAFRRLARPGGPINRRLRAAGDSLTLPKRPAGVLSSGPESAILGELEPAQAILTRALKQIAVPSGMGVMTAPEPLQPIVRGPHFSAPMSVELQRLWPDALLPGAEHLRPDTAVLLEPNRPFVAAFLVGLNHEMSRELLWREFPTDAKATSFRVFWDRRGQADPSATLEELADIPPISGWNAGKALGDDVHAAPEGELVLVVRGELLRRYPRAVVSAVKAVPGTPRRLLADETVPGNRKWPLFSGFLEPDITYLGFALSEESARGDDDVLGWYFVFQEQPSEPRFGLDTAEESQSADPSPQTAPDGQQRPALSSADLAWGHLVDRDSFAELHHAPVLSARPAGWWFPDRKDLTWTGGSADLAALTLQRPARAAIHAELLLPARD